MHRLTARLLLVLLLVGTLAPAALAISAPLPHECCVRKPMHDHNSRGLTSQVVESPNRNCCPPVTTAHWAELESGIDEKVRPPLVYHPTNSRPSFGSNFVAALQPVRGPPLS